MPLATPHYLIDEVALARNLALIDQLRAASGAKCLLALKCFATWAAFPQIAPHMDGTTSSSLNEVKLGREKFAGETHAYSVAWSDNEIDDAIAHHPAVLSYLKQDADERVSIAAAVEELTAVFGE